MTYPAHIDLTQPCWITTGGTNAAGYGLVCIDGKWLLKHRISYALHIGKLLPKDHALHACDIPGCWNPAHIFKGTDQDNSDDKVRKGRQARGATHGQSKLTPQAVRKIRAADPGQGGELAREYGVSRNVIHAVRTGRTWKHVT